MSREDAGLRQEDAGFLREAAETGGTAGGPARGLAELLEETAARHKHLCPRQVLGVRMGLFAGELLGISVPQPQKQLVAIVETDGCAADGIAVATNCWVGRRTMRVEDYGKVAATFVDAKTGRAIRLVPSPDSRRLAAEAAPEEDGKWRRQLVGYQRVPSSELFRVEEVELKTPIEKIVSRAGARSKCSACGEEILNEREVVGESGPVCRACAGEAYYTVKALPASRS